MDSVLSQNTKYHILQTIVNDGSPDHSRDILSKYEHLPNVEIINQENQGFSGARNAGLKVIKGKYVAFLDFDDILSVGSIDVLMDKVIATDADIVEGGYATFLRKDEEVDVVKHQPTFGDSIANLYLKIKGKGERDKTKEKIIEHFKALKNK